MGRASAEVEEWLGIARGGPGEGTGNCQLEFLRGR